MWLLERVGMLQQVATTRPWDPSSSQPEDLLTYLSTVPMRHDLHGKTGCCENDVASRHMYGSPLAGLSSRKEFEGVSMRELVDWKRDVADEIWSSSGCGSESVHGQQ